MDQEFPEPLGGLGRYPYTLGDRAGGGSDGETGGIEIAEVVEARNAERERSQSL
jgi:hypothetical protein